MDVLLINPPWATKDGNLWHGVKSTSPPLGLLCVGAYAEQHGRKVHVLDVDVEQSDLEDIEAFIRLHQPQFIGITAVTTQIGVAHQVAHIAKRVSPRSKVVIGGVHATAMPDEVLEDRNIDYIIRGEGEKPFLALVEGQPLESIGGLSYRAAPLSPRKRGGFVAVEHNRMDEPIADLDSLPTPAYHLIKFERYKPSVGSHLRLPSVNMTMTRGCPGKCTFCNSAGTALRTRSAEHVVAEIELLQARYGIREVSFYDDTFTLLKRKVARFCDLIVERGIDLTWSCFARTDCVGPPLLKKMKMAGCHQILFGIESADPQILKNIRKPISLERTRRTVRMVQRAGITVRAAFMLGCPGETVESMRRTIDFAKDLRPDIAIFNITMPYPGTQMFEWARKNGYLSTLDWSEYDLANAVLELPTVSRDDINRMYRAAHREFYFRPSYVLRRLLKMRSLSDVKMHYRAMKSIMFVRSTNAPPSKRETTRKARSPVKLAPASGMQPARPC